MRMFMPTAPSITMPTGMTMSTRTTMALPARPAPMRIRTGMMTAASTNTRMSITATISMITPTSIITTTLVPISITAAARPGRTCQA